MPRIKPKIVAGKLYHVFNRGVEKRVIFPSQEYYLRFINGMKEFNTPSPVELRSTEVKPPEEKRMRPRNEPLVEIIAFILMPNHFHLLLRPLIDNGISLFMQKLGSGYVVYFNLTRSRVGGLFQGTYRIKHIDSDTYAKHMFTYIALNALDSEMPEWREGIVKNIRAAQQIVIRYPWSSFGNKKFSSIVNPEAIHDFFEDEQEFENFVFSWLKNPKDVVKQAKFNIEK